MMITLIIIFLQPWSVSHQTERHFWKNATDWGASSQWPSEHHSWKIAQVLDTTNTYTCQPRTSSCQTVSATIWGTPTLPKISFTGEIVQPFAPFTTLGTNIHKVFKNDDFADDWDAWPTTRRQTRILTWPELVTKMLPWLRISKYFKANVSQYQEGWMALDHNIYHVFFLSGSRRCAPCSRVSPRLRRQSLRCRRGGGSLTSKNPSKSWQSWRFAWH